MTTDVLLSNEYRVDGRDKVTGEARYSRDFSRPGMLWAAFAQSQSPHARIVAIDTAEARAMPGVRAILTGEDTGERRFGRRLFDYPVLAREKVRFVGEFVAAVAAETREQAEAAALAIVVEYEELTPVFEIAEALAAGAPVLHESPEGYRMDVARKPRSHPNVQGQRVIACGAADLAPIFASADRVIEQTFRTPRQHAAPMEPRATLVWIDDEGLVHVISPNKAPFALRQQFAHVTGLPEERIVIEKREIGGDFGGKALSIEEYPCYFLAVATGRPVKFVRASIDDLGSTTVRHSAEMTLRTAVSANGDLLAHEAHVAYNGGAYAAGKPGPLLMPGEGYTKIAYRIPNARIEIATVYTNTVPGGSVRAPGDVQTLFAFESHIDTIARELGIDPLAFREQNLLREGEAAVDGELFLDPRGAEVLAKLREASHWGTPLPPGRGRGVALSVRHIGGGKTSVKIRLGEDGRVAVLSGLPDQGTGAHTAVQRIAARALGVPLETIVVSAGSTAEAGADPGSGGSRVVHIVGGATLDGMNALVRRLESAAATVLGEPPGTVRFAAGRFIAGAREIPFADLAPQLAARETIEVVGEFDGVHHHGHPAHHNFSAYAIEVGVDRETGAVRIHDAVLVADVGTIINPVAHRGQINGGFVFGLGQAMFEELRVQDGRVVNALLADYKLPTAIDVPPLRTAFLIDTGGPGPFGAKMAGEAGNPGVAPAVANAIADAAGARVTELPLTAERVFDALRRDAVVARGAAV